MESGFLLQNAKKDKITIEKLLVYTTVLLHVQLRPANPADRALGRPGPLWKTLEILFLTERGEGEKRIYWSCFVAYLVLTCF
jgi:hypothetical protein